MVARTGIINNKKGRVLELVCNAEAVGVAAQLFLESLTVQREQRALSGLLLLFVSPR